MLPDKLEERLIEILKEQTGLQDIKPETELHKVYTDSLDKVEVILAIEGEYGLELPDSFEKGLEDYAAGRRTNRPTVKDMADYLRETNPIKPSAFGKAAEESVRKLLRR
jgi:acyl carrier protein